MFIATLIAADRLSSGDISAAEDALRHDDIEVLGRSWIEADVACDLIFSGAPEAARDVLEGLLARCDVVVQPESGRRKRLLVADMDSTMITVECIDELADYAGLKAEVGAITERAMQGELGFEAALKERVALLRGLDEALVARCHAERVRIMPGAIPLVRTMKRAGAGTVLVSGGFSLFADKVAHAIGFDKAVSNRLDIGGGKLKGTVAMPIVGADAKRAALVEAAANAGVDLPDTLAVGDGANDVPMLKAAGLGVAYHAKPAAVEAAAGRIEHCDLGALLYSQGYARAEWIED